MEKERLLELLKSEPNKVDAIGMILSNYTDFGHTEKGGMVSVAQFKKVAECILEWSGDECSSENGGLNIPVVVFSEERAEVCDFCKKPALPNMTHKMCEEHWEDYKAWRKSQT